MVEPGEPMFDKDGYCVACGELIPPEYQARHAAGLDTRRLACPHQDVDALKEERRAYERRWRGYVW